MVALRRMVPDEVGEQRQLGRRGAHRRIPANECPQVRHVSRRQRPTTRRTARAAKASGLEIEPRRLIGIGCTTALDASIDRWGEPEERDELPDPGGRNPCGLLGRGLQEMVQPADQSVVEELIRLPGGDPQHEFTQHRGSTKPHQVESERLPLPDELEIRQGVEVAVPFEVERRVAFGERLEQPGQATLGSESTASDDAQGPVRARKQTENLARVAVTMDLENHGLRRNDRHQAKLCGPLTTGNSAPSGAKTHRMSTSVEPKPDGCSAIADPAPSSSRSRPAEAKLNVTQIRRPSSRPVSAQQSTLAPV